MEGRGSENKGRRSESDKDCLDEHIEDKCDCCSSLVGVIVSLGHGLG